MFKVGEAVVLKNSSQNKVMKIQAHNDEFIRAYCGDQDYSFAHESNFRHATKEEIAVGHRIECSWRHTPFRNKHPRLNHLALSSWRHTPFRNHSAKFRIL